MIWKKALPLKHSVTLNSLSRKILRATIIIFVSLIVTELCLRMYFFGFDIFKKPFFEKSNCPCLSYEMVKNTTYTSTVLNYKKKTEKPFFYFLNSRGFRGKEFNYTQKIPRVVILGDSVAFGWGINDDKIFSTLLGKKFNNKIEIINLAVPGYNIDEEICSYHNVAGNPAADILILSFFINDFDRPIMSKIQALLASKSLVVRTFIEIIARSKAKKFDSSIEEKAREIVRNLQNQAREKNFYFLIFVPYHRGKIIGAYSEFLQYCKSQRIDVIGDEESFLMEADHFIPGDGHPSEKGHAILAERLGEYLEKRIQTLINDPCRPRNARDKDQ
ncbi:MAG: SGNH/GDSL hydrolase family protein [Thermodesulfobacteriota bacterium]